jgi:hypothetical protein
MIENIPLELRQLPQWVCWRYETSVSGRPTKVPYNPRTMQRADSTDSATWVDFQTAAGAPGFSGIGFVLTNSDPYTVIDLDDKEWKPATPEQHALHQKILDYFPSYAERSPSGRGYHVVLKGKLPQSLQRDTVEIYSQSRYIAFTGNVINQFPIAEMQDRLNVLAGEMPPRKAAPELEEVEGVLTDAEVFDMALNAINGHRFAMLTQSADWASMQKANGEHYASQSEADQALLSMLCFYSRDNDQVKRIFRCSPLGKREKANKDDVYVNRTIRHLRSNDVSSADLEQARENADAMLANAIPAAPPAPTEPLPSALTIESAPEDYWPPGLVGDLAGYFYNAAVRPNKDIALCSALGLLAGITGRQYNISETGLNHYILVLGVTGTGKEAMASSISRIMQRVYEQIPQARDFVGPGHYASGQALIKTFKDQKSFISVLGEFSQTLQTLNDPRASAAVVMQKRVMLDLWNKSGWGDVLYPMVYSDADKNTQPVRAPACSILAETNPTKFYEIISAGDISDGFLPRFHILESKEDRPDRNRHAGIPPSPSLVNRLCDVIQQSLILYNNNQCSRVSLEPDALAELDAFDKLCDAKMKGRSEHEKQLWNRDHLKALRLAAVLAVSCAPGAPVVTLPMARWAIQFTHGCTNALMQKFFAGEVGVGDAKQSAELKRVVIEYFKHSKDDLKRYKCDPELQRAKLIPYNYFWVRCAQLSAFYRDARGAARCLQSALDTLVHSEQLVVVEAGAAFSKFGKRQKLFGVGSSF